MEEFDAIIVGAGHQGLILANYLARSNFSVLVLERRHEFGGGLSNEELTLPGFRHCLHSHFHTASFSPWYRDLEMEKYGVRYIFPDARSAMPLDDGRCMVLYGDLDKTC